MLGEPSDADALPPGTVSVVLVNYRSLADLARLLDGPQLRGQRVVVVDNGDDPEGVRRLCAEHQASAVLLPDNVGFAAGVNAGVAALPGDAQEPVLLLNPDVCVTAATLLGLLAEIERGGDGAAPLLVQPGGRLQIGAAGGEFTTARIAAYFLFVSHAFPRVTGVFLTRRQSLQRRPVAWLCMACVLLRRDALVRFGPLPEDELVYAEDLAWGTSASLRGADLRLVPELRVTHATGSSGGSALWVGSFERLCLRRLGPVSGRVGVLTMRIGLLLRRLVGRQVS